MGRTGPWSNGYIKQFYAETDGHSSFSLSRTINFFISLRDSSPCERVTWATWWWCGGGMTAMTMMIYSASRPRVARRPSDRIRRRARVSGVNISQTRWVSRPPSAPPVGSHQPWTLLALRARGTKKNNLFVSRFLYLVTAAKVGMMCYLL